MFVNGLTEVMGTIVFTVVSLDARWASAKFPDGMRRLVPPRSIGLSRLQCEMVPETIKFRFCRHAAGRSRRRALPLEKIRQFHCLALMRIDMKLKWRHGLLILNRARAASPSPKPLHVGRTGIGRTVIVLA